MAEFCYRMMKRYSESAVLVQNAHISAFSINSHSILTENLDCDPRTGITAVAFSLNTHRKTSVSSDTSIGPAKHGADSVTCYNQEGWGR